MVKYFVGTPSDETAIQAESAGDALVGLSEASTGVLGFHGDPRLQETNRGLLRREGRCFRG